MNLLELALRPLIDRTALRVWSHPDDPQGVESLPPEHVRQVLAAGWQRYGTLRRDGFPARSLGNRHVLMLSRITLAFFTALLDAGLPRDRAVRLVSLAVWQLFQPVTDLAWLVARLRTHERLEQVRFMMLLSLRYPFCPPGFVSQAHPSSESVRVDFRRCLAAEYLAERGAADLCVGAWCQQDYRLAERWGVALLRSGTRAGGAAKCDFCFQLLESTPSASGSGR